MERFIIHCHENDPQKSKEYWKNAFGINEAAAKMLFEIQNPHLKVNAIYPTSKATLVK